MTHIVYAFSSLDPGVPTVETLMEAIADAGERFVADFSYPLKTDRAG